jgi:3-phenylpropionate/cinnamic acid dioxygenase small subunit
MITRLEAETFLYYEARLLDENDLRAWSALLTDDVIYWVPNNRDDVAPSEHISIVYNDRRSLEGRIWRISESGINHSQDPPTQTVRFISNVEVEAGPNAGEAVVRCNLLLHIYRPGMQRRDEAPSSHAARCRYVLRGDSGALKIAYKKVALLEMDAPLPPMTFVI